MDSYRPWYFYVTKHLKDKKNVSFKIHPRMKNMFLKFKEAGIKIHAYTEAKLIMTYSHECISNILNAVGVKSRDFDRFSSFEKAPWPKKY